jgi:hypothetical protein
MPAAMVHLPRPSVPARPGAALRLINPHRRPRVRRSNPHSASRKLTVPIPRFPPLAVCVRRPSVYAAPSSWPASANVHITDRSSNVGFRSRADQVADREGGLASRASPVHTALRNCTGDEGGPFGFGDQVADPKPPQAAVGKSHSGERCGKAGTLISTGEVERGERKRTAAEASKFP